MQIHIRDVDNELLAQSQGPGAVRKQTDTVDVTITVSKGTDPFQCEDMAQICGGMDTVTGIHFPPAVYTLVADYMKFKHDLLDIRRIIHSPIVPFDGQVSFPVAHHVFPTGEAEESLGSILPLEQPFESPNKCFIPQATICVSDYERANTMIACTKTDTEGKFHVPVGIHSLVTATVEWNAHTFALVEGSNIATDLILKQNVVAEDGKASVETIFVVRDSQSDLRHVDFTDRSGQIIHLGAHGTHCRKSMSTEALFKVQVSPTAYKCDPRNDMEVIIPTALLTYTRVMLPGHDITITLDALEPAWPQVTDKSDFGYFHRLRQRTRRLDLLDESVARIQLEQQAGGTPRPEPVLEYVKTAVQ